jgi:hypothetical protein
MTNEVRSHLSTSSRPVGCIPCTTNDDRLCFLSFGDLIPDQFNKHRTREQGDDK